MAKLTVYTDNNTLRESFQANEIKFAFVNPVGEDFQAVHPFVKCREYFNELLMKNYHPEKFHFVTTYGFAYRHDKFPLDLSATRIALSFPTEEQKATFIKSLPFIHKVEDANSVDHTEVVDIDARTVIVLASKFWIQKALLTNIYTLLLKLAGLGAGQVAWTDIEQIRHKQQMPSEVYYVQQLTPKNFNNVLANCTVIADLPTKYIDGTDQIRGCGAVHAYSGLLTLWNCLSSTVYDDVIDKLAQILKPILQGETKHNFLEVTA